MSTYQDFKANCMRLSKRNNSLLYKIEKYLGHKLLENEDLIEIRDAILTNSAEINKLPELFMKHGDTNEGL